MTAAARPVNTTSRRLSVAAEMPLSRPTVLMSPSWIAEDELAHADLALDLPLLAPERVEAGAAAPRSTSRRLSTSAHAVRLTETDRFAHAHPGAFGAACGRARPRRDPVACLRPAAACSTTPAPAQRQSRGRPTRRRRSGSGPRAPDLHRRRHGVRRAVDQQVALRASRRKPSPSGAVRSSDGHADGARRHAIAGGLGELGPGEAPAFVAWHERFGDEAGLRRAPPGPARPAAETPIRRAPAGRSTGTAIAVRATAEPAVREDERPRAQLDANARRLGGGTDRRLEQVAARAERPCAASCAVRPARAATARAAARTAARARPAPAGPRPGEAAGCQSHSRSSVAARRSTPGRSLPAAASEHDSRPRRRRPALRHRHAAARAAADIAASTSGARTGVEERREQRRSGRTTGERKRRSRLSPSARLCTMRGASAARPTIRARCRPARPPASGARAAPARAGRPAPAPRAARSARAGRRRPTRGRTRRPGRGTARRSAPPAPRAPRDGAGRATTPGQPPARTPAQPRAGRTAGRTARPACRAAGAPGARRDREAAVQRRVAELRVEVREQQAERHRQRAARTPARTAHATGRTNVTREPENGRAAAASGGTTAAPRRRWPRRPAPRAPPAAAVVPGTRRRPSTAAVSGIDAHRVEGQRRREHEHGPGRRRARFRRRATGARRGGRAPRPGPQRAEQQPHAGIAAEGVGGQHQRRQTRRVDRVGAARAG